MNKVIWTCIITVCLLFISKAHAQVNLVPNPSFEDNHGKWICPDGSGDSIPWPDHWVSPTLGDPDYLVAHFCLFNTAVPQNFAGWQIPFNGDAYMHISIVSDTIGSLFREYIQAKLLDILETGHKYCLSFRVSMDDSSARATDDLGAFFSDTAIIRNDAKNFPFVPQIKNQEGVFITNKCDWVLFYGSFNANGGERYITIGNFLDDYQTDWFFAEPYSSYVPWQSFGSYYIDMVSLYDCTGFNYSANAGGNVTLCKGDSTTIGTDDDSSRKYSWSPSIGLDDSTKARPRAAPTVTTTYVLTVIDEYIQQTSDAITVIVDTTCGVFPVYVPNVFSPNGDGINDVLYVRSDFARGLNFKVYNRWGGLVYETSEVGAGWDGKYRNQDCQEGVYFYVAEVSFNGGGSVVKKGSVTIVR